ncbi:MAG: M6 family metalloprotease domain-containing protein [Ignavibacteriales bacterium]|nr:M6 family metalloprotease domain-containing protein [Ignavibacteriales bacterium]
MKNKKGYFKLVNRIARRLFLLLSFTYIFYSLSFCSIPPHPRVEEKIKKGNIKLPYQLAYKQEALQRGINSGFQRIRNKKDDVSKIINGSSYHALALLVQFNDKKGVSRSSYFDSLLFESSGKTLRNYYKEISYGQLDIITINLPSSTNWISLNENYSYYVDGQNGFGSYPKNSQKLVEDAVMLGDSLVDYSKYDNDGDGFVDALFIIHAGTGAEFTGDINDIWSHQWSTYSPVQLDGVNIFTYTIQPEYWQYPNDMTCGVFAHEFGHMGFNLPDLYDYGQDSKGLGRWSLMASGSWNGSLGDSPSHPDAWSRIKMGFSQSKLIENNIMNHIIQPVEDDPTILKLIPSGGNGYEYYLLENRKKKGFDASLRGEGLLIYHVDETQLGNSNQWYPGRVSNGNYLVALEQADGKYELDKNINAGDAGDPFPGLANNTLFNSSSIPNSLDYLFNSTKLAVSNIRYSDGTITANIYGQNSYSMPSVLPSAIEISAFSGETIFRNIVIKNNSAENISIIVKHDSTSNTLLSSISLMDDDLSVECIQKIIAPEDSLLINIKLSTSGMIEGMYRGSLVIQADDNSISVMVNVTVHDKIQDAVIQSSVLKGWNIISLPLKTVDNNVKELFPDALTLGYSYRSGGGFLKTQTINVGQGYWMKFLEMKSLNINGTVMDTLTIPLKEGWNMIGTSDFRVSEADIIQEPPTLLSSNFFDYNNGFNICDTLDPGKGYWIKASSEGEIKFVRGYLHSSSFIKNVHLNKDNISSTLKFSIDDSTEKELYFSDSKGNDIINFELPPVPPEEILDIRFKSNLVNSFGSIIDCYNEKQINTYSSIVTIQSDTYPIILQWSEKNKSGLSIIIDEVVNGIVLNTHRINSDEEILIADSEVKELRIQFDKRNNLIDDFKLEQNYPNPFNPVTDIRYWISDVSQVSIKVFDVLGREVATLVNELKEQGEYTVRLNAEDLPSGVYFYSLQTVNLSGGNRQSFSDVKKLVVTK